MFVVTFYIHVKYFISFAMEKWNKLELHGKGAYLYFFHCKCIYIVFLFNIIHVRMQMSHLMPKNKNLHTCLYDLLINTNITC